MDLIERLTREAAAWKEPHGAGPLHRLLGEAAAELTRLREERDAAKRELDFTKKGKGGWDAFELARKDLGEIIGDDYEGRSMWPRLARVKLWWSQMKAERDAAHSKGFEECRERAAGIAQRRARLFATGEEGQCSFSLMEECEDIEQAIRSLSPSHVGDLLSNSQSANKRDK